jgi:hypothetical protein
MDTYHPLQARLRVVIHKIINQPLDTWYIMTLYGKMLLYSKLMNMLLNWNKRDETPKLTSWVWLSSSNTNFNIIHIINSRCWCKVMELGRGIHVPQIVSWISNNIISWIHMHKTFENWAWKSKGQMELHIGTKFDAK